MGQSEHQKTRSMIDTVRLKVLKEQNEHFYQFCMECSSSKHHGFIVHNKHKISEREPSYIFKEIEYENNSYQLINGKLFNPSSTYNTVYQIKEEFITFELSLPKFIYGTNSIQLINHINFYDNNAYNLFTKAIKYFFNTVFLGQRINYDYVLLERFDVCFNQYFDNYDQSKEALDFMKLKVNGKLTQKDYETGLISISKSSYNKIYHKGHEFAKKDSRFFSNTLIGQKKIRENGLDYHDKIFQLSSCCLRYENQYKPSNWSYDYMTKYSQYSKHFQGYKNLIKMKDTLNHKQKTVLRDLQKIFKDTRIKFTLTDSPLNSYNNIYPLKHEYFNYLVRKYYDFIQKNYSLKQNSTTELSKAIIQPKHLQINKTMKVRILSIIKTFGSLELAKSRGCLSYSTYKRYKKFLDSNNLSTTKVKIEIPQDWTFLKYRQKLNELEINIYDLNKYFD